ncbi:MAG: alpha/beta fold hydrolase, partial [candidate division NC10 bacterium]|nr:alpha/beta fold hydrolase [candidate division NC10 bacterium]
MPLAEVNGIHLFYDEAGAGRPVIFVHAYPMGRRMWAPQVAHFQARYRVLTYDCRGFGDSEAPPGADSYS